MSELDTIKPTQTNEQIIEASGGIVRPDVVDVMFALMESGELQPAEIARIHDRVCCAQQVAKEIRARCESIMLGLIKAGGTIRVPRDDGSAVLYCSKPDKTIKPRDKAAVLDAVLAETGGDLAVVCDYLSSDPFKQGSIRKLVGDERHAKLFETVEKDKLDAKTEKLSIIDTRFLK